MPGLELDPTEHIGLVPLALSRWTRIRRGTEWEDSEEWSAAVEGIVHGCQTYRAASGWKPSTWLMWHMRSKLTMLRVKRERQKIKWDIACEQEASRQRHYASQVDQCEDTEWLLYQAARLPWPESTIVRRLVQGEDFATIAAALKVFEKTVRRHYESAITRMREAADRCH